MLHTIFYIFLFLVINRHPPSSTLFPYTTLFRSAQRRPQHRRSRRSGAVELARSERDPRRAAGHLDRKSTRLNSSHLVISYAVFCLKKKKKNIYNKLF